VSAEATYALRQRLLRPHQTVDELRLPDDDDPETGMFAALTDSGSGSDTETVVATGSIRREHCPWQPERQDSWRLRSMATEPAVRGQGLGTAVLNAALAHVAMLGGGLVWCKARTKALSFYQRAGFVSHGSEWEDPQIGPHVHMWREVIEPLG